MQIKINYEFQFPISLILKDEIRKINQLKKHEKQPKLIRQTHDPSHYIKIVLQKENKKMT